MKKLTDVLGAKVMSSHDILLVRRAYAVDTNPNFSHKGMFGTRQYSDAFVDWVVAEHTKDTLFCQKVREAERAKRKRCEQTDTHG